MIFDSDDYDGGGVMSLAVELMVLVIVIIIYPTNM